MSVSGATALPNIVRHNGNTNQICQLDSMLCWYNEHVTKNTDR